MNVSELLDQRAHFRCRGESGSDASGDASGDANGLARLLGTVRSVCEMSGAGQYRRTSAGICMFDQVFISEVFWWKSFYDEVFFSFFFH